MLCVAERFADEFGFGVGLLQDGNPEPGVDRNLPGSFEHAVTLLRLEHKLDGLRELLEDTAKRLRGSDPVNQ